MAPISFKTNLMNYRNLLLFMIAVGMLTGCAGPKVLDASPEHGPVARMRVLTTGAFVYLHPNTSCYTLYDKAAIPAYSGGKDYGLFDGLAQLSENRKVGMPVTDDITWAYNEFIVQANQPMTIYATYVASGEVGGQWRYSSCGPFTGSFSPEPGKDYDAGLMLEGGRCYLRVRELVTDDLTGKVKPIEMTIGSASQCK